MSYVVKAKGVSNREESSVLSNATKSSSNRKTRKWPTAFRIKEPLMTERSAVMWWGLKLQSYGVGS